MRRSGRTPPQGQHYYRGVVSQVGVDSFRHHLRAVVLLMQTDGKSDDQGNKAGNRNC